jgi:hypothetical protein
MANIKWKQIQSGSKPIKCQQNHKTAMFHPFQQNLLLFPDVITFHSTFPFGKVFEYILKTGVTNLFEPESYFMGTESYEGHPV